jgi:Arc/MetJ-type ribon-helix-helix transcriptional regulator
MEKPKPSSENQTLKLTTFRLPEWQRKILRKLGKGRASAFVRNALTRAIEQAALNDSFLFEQRNEVVTGMTNENPKQEVAAFSSNEGGAFVFSDGRANLNE